MNTDPPAHVIADLSKKLAEDVMRHVRQTASLVETMDGRRHLLTLAPAR